MILLFFLTPNKHFRDGTYCFLKLNIVTVFPYRHTTPFQRRYDVVCLRGYGRHFLYKSDIFCVSISFTQEGLLSSNVTCLLGTKLEKMSIIVSLKIETCLLTILLLNKVSQFTDSVETLCNRYKHLLVLYCLDDLL